MELSKEKILIQLNKIITSRLFHESYKLKRFLTYVVTETLGNRVDLLKQYNIAIHAFDRDKDFDSDSDPIVRIQAGRLRTSLTVYYSTEGKDDPILITMPTGSYKPTFELKKKEEKLLMFQNDVIAVEPVKNLSKDSKNQYMVDGFTEELLLELSMYDHLTIIRLASSNHNSEAANRFARFILRGSFRFDGVRIKLVVLVEDIKDQDVIWSQNFDLFNNPKKLIQSQEEIARAVANKIGDVIGGVVINRLFKESREKSIEEFIAYDALLKFYHYQKAPLIERFLDAMETTKKVLDGDPQNGICWTILSTLTIDAVALGLGNKLSDGLTEALDYAIKAVNYEPNMQITRTHLSYAYLMNNQLEKSVEQAKIALEFNPNAAYYVGSLGWLMALSGKWEAGLSYIEDGIYLNPGYPTWQHQAPCFYYLGNNDFEKALVHAINFSIPDMFWDPLLKAVCYAYCNNSSAAKKSANKLLEMEPEFSLQGEELIRMYVKDESHFIKIVEGLEMAGLQLVISVK